VLKLGSPFVSREGAVPSFYTTTLQIVTFFYVYASPFVYGMGQWAARTGRHSIQCL
jgi:hypothetical protein